MNSKSRILYLLKLLYEITDEEHALSTNDIVQYFQERSVATDRKTVKNDINILSDFGMDIITIKSSQNKYYIRKRLFDIPELKLLIDAVESSKFITLKKSEELVKKITGLASKNQANQLNRHLYVTNRVELESEEIYNTVDIINDAINSKKKIQFKYYEYTVLKRKVLKNNGELYKISPYALLWNENHYYVIGYSEKYNRIVKFRVERMYNLKQTKELSIDRPWDFDVADYSKKVFDMYGGKLITVELQCENELMKVIIDRFSEDVETKPIDATTFKAKLEISESPTFYGWIFQFEGKIKILNPKTMKDEYQRLIKMSIE